MTGDLVSFLQRCILGLVPNHGVIIVKENVSTDEDDFDDEDSSVTRYVMTRHGPGSQYW